MLILPVSAIAQVQASPVASQRLAYDSIEHRLPSYHRVQPNPDHLKFNEDEEVPVALEAYCDGNKLRLVVATYAQEAGHSIDRYYFRNDLLFFLYHRSEIPTGPDAPNRVDEERLYFSADTLVRWLGAHNTSRALVTLRAKRRSTEALARASTLEHKLRGCSDHPS
jgi:hypothetical protein